MKSKLFTFAFTLLLMLLIASSIGAEETPTTVSNLTSLLKDNTQKATYNIDLNAPFVKENCGIKEYISSETGELSILQKLISLPGRNGMDLVLQAQYKNLDAKLFSETTRSGNISNSYGQTIVAIYDVFDQEGYWLRNGGLIYSAGQTITEEFSYNSEKWLFTGNIKYESGTSIITTSNMVNATQEKSKALTGRYMMGTGWSFYLPYLEVQEEEVYVHFLDGRTYKADFNSKNGLEKYEIKDLLFDKSTAFNCGGLQSAYRLSYKDGKELFFASDGFLLGQRDRYNNTIRYYYEEKSGITVLTKIEDSVGRIVNIEYNDSATIITSGQSRITMMKRPVQGYSDRFYLNGFIDPAGREIKYKYSMDTAEFDSVSKTPAQNTYINLREIQYPTGAKTVYDYTKGRKNLGSSGSMEYFKVKERYDEEGNNIIDRLTYQYWNEPDGYPLHRDKDNIPETYRYETSARNSKGVTTRYIFNGKHLPVNTKVDGKRLMSETLKIFDSESHLPLVSKERKYNNSGSYQEKIDYYEYDSRGNIISENHPVGEYQGDERKSYYVFDSRYNILLSKKYKQDAKTNLELKYSLSSDGKNIDKVETKANGKLISRKDYKYDDYGNIMATTSKKTDTEDVKQIFEYDVQYNHAYLTSKSVIVRDADGRSSTVKTKFTYDFKTGSKISDTDGNGNISSYKYDLLNRLVRKTNPDNTFIQYVYDDSKNIAYVTDERKNQKTYYFDALGKLSHVKDDELNVELVKLKYDDMENLIQEISPNGNYKEYTYDQINRLVNIAYYDENKNNLAETVVSYNEAYQDRSGYLQRISVINKADSGKNDILQYYYFDSGEKLVKTGRIQNNKEYFENYRYDYLDNCTQTSDFKGNLTNLTYDGLKHLIKEQNALGNSRSYSYDYMGNQVAQTDELGNVTRIEYDALGRIIKTSTPFENGLDSVNKIYYDAAGNIIKKIDPEGSVSKYILNNRNQLTMLEQILGPNESSINKYEYDASGNLSRVLSGFSSMTDTAKSVTQYQYDSLNRIISNIDPSGNKEIYHYDANGNIVTKIDRNGKTVETEYDGLNRPVIIQSAFNGQMEKNQYSYDKLGNPVRMQDSLGTSTYAYDNLGRLSKIQRDKGVSLNYVYDILNQRTGMTLKQGNDVLMDIQYSYNAIGSLINVREQGRTVRYQYDAAMRLTDTINEVTGIETNYKLNQAGMLKSLVNQQAGNIISYYEYEYDRRGNQISKDDKNGTTRYYYDSLSRIKTVTMPDDIIQNYSYDNLGNLSELMESTNGRLKQTTYSYNQNSQLLLQEESQGADTTKYIFDYDANGNQIAKDELQYYESKLIASRNTSFRFDSFNKLREVMTPENKRVNYEYYGDGLRASKEVDGDITRFTYDGQNIVLETDADSIPKAKNFFGKRLISRQTTEDDMYYYLFNGHGDVSQLLDQKGEVIKDYEYDPFGKARNSELPLIPGKVATSLWKNEIEKVDNPFQYAGEYLDQETGYYYLRARYYDPQSQRFISKDSVEGDITNPLSLNLYTYCANNPLIYIDPSGNGYVWNNYGEIIGTTSGSDYTDRSQQATETHGGEHLKNTVWKNASNSSDNSSGAKSDNNYSVYNSTAYKWFEAQNPVMQTAMAIPISFTISFTTLGAIVGSVEATPVLIEVSTPVVKHTSQRIIEFSYRHGDKIIQAQNALRDWGNDPEASSVSGFIFKGYQVITDIIKTPAVQKVIDKGKIWLNNTSHRLKSIFAE